MQKRHNFIGNAMQLRLFYIKPPHDDIIKWKHFLLYWPFVLVIHRPGEFPTQKPLTRSFDVFFDLRLNKRLSKQLR